MNIWLKTKNVARAFCLVAAGITLLSSPSLAADQISVSLYPKGSAEVNPITATFMGKMYDYNLWLEDAIAQPLPLEPDEAFILSIYTANKSGTQADVLNLWAPDEVAEMSSYIQDNALFAQNQSLYKSITSSAFIAKVLYGEQIVFFIQHAGLPSGTFVMEYRIKKVNNRFYQSNKLADDSLFFSLTSKLREKFVLKSR